MPDFDAIIIGTGQAGPSLAFRLAGAGMKVAVVERHLVGGTCVNTGCTPTKAMVASAYAARIARRAAEYGVVIGGDVGIDMRRVKARKDAIVAASRNGRTSALENAANITLYRGHARFASPQVVEIPGERLRAERIFVNVGGRALVPPMPGITEVPYLTNSSMMDIDFLPQHLIIVGGSYVGLEFGQMYRRFGGQVTIIEMAPRLVRHEDEDVSAAIKDIVEREGVEIRLNAECISLVKRGDEIVAKVDCTAGAPEVTGSHLLLAVGRRPNTDDLDLDKAGVRCDERGYILVDDQLQTTAPGIWALGDCNGKGAFHPHRVQRFRDRRSESARPRPAPGQRACQRLCPLHRPAIGPRRHDLGRGTQQWAAGAGRRAVDDARCPRRRKGRDARLYAHSRRWRQQRDPRRLIARYGMRRGCPRDPRSDVCQSSVHGHAARDAR